MNNTSAPLGFIKALFGEDFPGYVTLWTKQDKKTYSLSKDSLIKVEPLVENLSLSKDTYIGMGLQEKALPMNERGSAQTVIGLPGFWLDVDILNGVHKRGGLPKNLGDVNKLLDAFADESPSRMLPTLIVSSGGGVHVYWLFKEPLIFENSSERDEAARLSRRFQHALREIARKHGWELDNTSDLARILRLPGTFNHKSTPPMPVKLIEYHEDRRYDPGSYEWLPDAPDGIVRIYSNEEREEISRGLEQDSLAEVDPILDGCPWLRHCRDDAASLSEPEWYAMLSILGRCYEGRERAHEWSKPYPGYSQKETDDKLGHALDAAGPRTCEYIAANGGSKYCRTCPNRGRIKSPIVLGATADNSQAPAVQWPDPLAAEALYGLAGEIVRTIEPHTEADPAAVLFQVLSAFGVTIGRGPHFYAERTRHTGNLYAVIVGSTSKARKGTSFDYIADLFSGTEPDWRKERVASGLSSGEGLIWAVRDPITKTEPIKEKGKVITYSETVVDPGVADKRLLVYEPEFASTLRVLERDGNTLSPILREAWDTGDLRSLTKNSPARASGACVGIIAHITGDELRLYLTRTEAGNGFANRFLYVCAARSKFLPEGGNLDERTLSSLRKEIREAVEFSRGVDRMYRDEEARLLWRKVYPEISRDYPGLLGSVTSRAEALVLRLSCLYALLDRSSTVRKEHLMAALAAWKYCFESARFVFGDSVGHPIADTILRALRETSEGLTRNEIYNLFQRHKKSSAIAQALKLLANHGRARMSLEKADGQTIERWFAVSPAALQGKREAA